MPLSSGASATASINAAERRLQSIARQENQNVEIHLNNAHGTHGKWLTSYSSLDKLEGSASITTNRDTRFDNLEISFVGTSRTFIDRGAAAQSFGGRVTATQTFLKLIQPIDEANLPHPRLFSAKQTYSIPFSFVIPSSLPDGSCSHNVDHESVRDSHLMVPPSMGDPMVSGYASNLVDDMAPEMTKVVYFIQVKASRQYQQNEPLIVLDSKRKMRVKPAFYEQPPLSVDANDSDYRLRRETTIRKGLFKGKIGTLVIEGSQPQPLHVPGARTSLVPVLISTVVRLLLRFDPSDDSYEPPSLGTLSCRIKSSTFYSTNCLATFPSKATVARDGLSGCYSTSVPLPSRSIANTRWQRHDASPGPAGGQGSAAAGGNPLPVITSPSTTYCGKTYYTANIFVPITLPLNKNFLPTFHSCLLSRTYAVSISLATQSVSARKSLSLKIPMQVTAGPSPDLPANAVAVEDDHQLEPEVGLGMPPRSMSMPSRYFPEAQSSSDSESLPDYSPPAPRSAARMST